MQRKVGRTSIPNPLIAREPPLVEALSAHREVAYDTLLNALAAELLKDPAFRRGNAAHPMEELKATVQILRILTKESWDELDLKLFDACWRDASGGALFANEFESERFRIRYLMNAARQEFRATDHRGGFDARAEDRESETAEHLRQASSSNVESARPSPYAQPSLFAAKTYYGTRTEQGVAVIVEENGKRRDLNPRGDLRKHATRLDWDYSDGGTAQLALALAADVLGDDEQAQSLYQRLQCKLLVGLPRDGWSLSEDQLRSALKGIGPGPGHTR